MSSTNKTTKIQLNQWVAADPVLRADFNSDNAKIDAAFREVDSSFSSTNASISALGASVLALPNTRITEQVFSTSAHQVDINLGVDLWDYKRINIVATLKTASNASDGSEGAYLILNGMTGVYGYPSTSGSASQQTGLSYLYAGSAQAVAYVANFELFISKASFTSSRIVSVKGDAFYKTNTSDYRFNADMGYGNYVTSSAASIQTIGFMMSSTSSRLVAGHVAVYGIK